jgi:hypothetical protein
MDASEFSRVAKNLFLVPFALRRGMNRLLTAD